jgi:hypothetical protein
MNVRMTCLLLGALLFGCESKQPIGENDPDASLITGDGGDDDDGGAGADAAPSTCACDASSCGSRICGRSECGFPCGQCGPGSSCLLGTGCSGGSDNLCVDAFGENVGVLDLGFRACPGDPTKQQRCMCNGGGPDDWSNCDTACIAICAQVTPGIACGAPGCTTGQVCCIPIVGNMRTCGTTCDGLSFTRECDGPEDCTTGSSCCGNSDDDFTATCTAGATCGADSQFCHTTDDCPSSKPHCCPGPVDDMRRCSASTAPTCT